ncbi:hypothetical protein AUC61_15805 [Pseudomonas sp. S25]|uniref:Uncharacterized protein n=1 Tax=Pseudomonas maioricensis TaxID=1766623 RepID=A0ABS9ZK91_9PSED|nr:hypothetical protein [Pseudomonas sp. S25]
MIFPGDKSGDDFQEVLQRAAAFTAPDNACLSFLFIQAFQSLTGALHGGHFLGTVHSPPFADVFFVTAAAHT